MNDIKTMKLYSHTDRVLNELAALGKSQGDVLTVDELSGFDQLHYHGVDAVQSAIDLLQLNSQSHVLEVGSGFGGPARYLAKTCGCSVSALELQSDLNQVAQDLTQRCQLADQVHHLAGDMLDYNWGDQRFDAIVSWLAIYHILDRPRLLKNCYDIMNPGGQLFFEDLTTNMPFSAEHQAILKSKLYGQYLPSAEEYKEELRSAGFAHVKAKDMTNNWRQYTQARLTQYRNDREVHVGIHNEQVVDDMDEFYEAVNTLFESGSLGGIQVSAVKE